MATAAAAPGCPSCPEAERPVNAVQVALLVIVAALAIYYLARFLGCLGPGREGFASRAAQEVHDRAREVFEEGKGDARYSEYKSRVPGADPVQYADVRRLFREGRMTPYSVEGVM